MEQYRKKRRRQAWLALGTLSLLWEIPAGLRCAITRPLISGWEIYDLVHSKWTYTKIGTIQRRLAWPLRKDDTQIREAFQIFSTLTFSRLTTVPFRDWKRLHYYNCAEKEFVLAHMRGRLLFTERLTNVRWTHYRRKHWEKKRESFAKDAILLPGGIWIFPCSFIVFCDAYFIPLFRGDSKKREHS